MAKNKKIVEGEEDEDEEEIYDEEYDIKPVTTLPKSDSSLNINKEISINDHPEDLVVGANSPLEINNSTKTDNPEVPLDLDSNNSNNSNAINSIDNSSNIEIKKSSDGIKSNLPKSNSILDIKKSNDTINNDTTTTTTITAANLLKEDISSPIQLLSTSPIPSLSSSTSSQNLNEQQSLSKNVQPQRKLSASQPQQPVRIPLSLGEHKLKDYNETLRKSFCARSHNLYFSINKEVTNANQHLSSVLDIVKSIQHNIRQSNDDILILSEKLEQTEWALQC